MKILLINKSAYPESGGVQNSLLHIAQELLNLGAEVTILCMKSELNDPDEIEYKSIKIRKLSYIPSRLPIINEYRIKKCTREAINKLILTDAVDLVIARNVTMAAGVLCSNYKNNLFCIYPTTTRLDLLGRILAAEGISKLRKLKLYTLLPATYLFSKRNEASVIKKAKNIVFSQLMKNELIASYGNIGDLKVINPGVSTERFHKSIGESYFCDFKKVYNLDKDEKLVLFVGRLAINKNIYMLLNAFSLIKAKSKLVIVGDGPERANLELYSKKIGIGDKIIFVGNQNEKLPGFYSISTVTVVPSKIETFGQSIIESMACGTPVVSFNSSITGVYTASKEIIKDGLNGFLVPEYNAEALAERIEKVLNFTPLELKSISNLCIGYVKESYSWENFVSELMLNIGDLHEPS